MFAIKIIPDKKKPDIWFLLRDTTDYVVYCWNIREEAEDFMKKLDFDNCEITEDIPTGAIRRFNERRDAQKLEREKND